MKKGFYKSKTFWFAVATMFSTAVPAVETFLKENPTLFTVGWGILAGVLRALTKDKVVLLE